jgi:hypothetical protein
VTARLGIRAVAPLASMLLTLGAPAARAQDSRLESRLDPRTRAAVTAVIDSARADALPTEPLVLKALEGASKRADGERIVTAVRSLARDLRNARAVLGSDAGEAELSAAAGALRAGASPGTLARLRAVRRGQSLAVPLAVLSDLIARGVPPDTASSIILSLGSAGARDDGFFALRSDVERDIMTGETPTVSAIARAHEIASGLSRGRPQSHAPPAAQAEPPTPSGTPPIN